MSLENVTSLIEFFIRNFCEIKMLLFVLSHQLNVDHLMDLRKENDDIKASLVILEELKCKLQENVIQLEQANQALQQESDDFRIKVCHMPSVSFLHTYFFALTYSTLPAVYYYYQCCPQHPKG